MSENKKDEEVKVIRSVSSKFVGYCSYCNLIISELNMVGDKYDCCRCGKKITKEELKKEIEKTKWESKKEYLQGNSGHYGSNFHMNKSTVEYNVDHTKKNKKDDDEENTLED